MARVCFAARVRLAALAAAGVLGAPPLSSYMNGVNLGGWLLTEPSWMSDVPAMTAPSEADLVARLRASLGDAGAVATMLNHWRGYLPDAAFDLLAALNVTHVRIPVGYWITEAPVAVVVPSPRGGAYDTGFNHEGFVTGGLAFLEAALAKLKARGVAAVVDLHALPGGASRCASYAGWQVSDVNGSFWRGSPPADAAAPVASACGGPYHSSRGAARPWAAVGADALRALGAWAAALEAGPLRGAVVAVEAANEPGLGFPGVQPEIERFLAAAVPALQAALAPAQAAAVNFIGPNDAGAGAWIAARVAAGDFDGARLIVDAHVYRNWDGPESWAALAARVCGATGARSDFAQFSATGLPVVVGEWSASTNLGARAFTDLSDPAVVARLRTLYANQASLFAARGSGAPGAAGAFYWTLRMGSGWDPRPAPGAPGGAQAAGSAWDVSLPAFGPAVWSLGELARAGVARPLAALAVTGVCECDGCAAGG